MTEKDYPILGHSITLSGDTFYLFGGRTKEKRLNDLHSFHIPTKTWTMISEGYQPPDILSWLETTCNDGILDTEDGSIVPEPRVLHSCTR